MSELISGKEALIALANDENVEYANSSLGCIRTNWLPVHPYQWTISDIRSQASENNGGECRFRLKPKIITINGTEVPAPFNPKDGETCFILSNFLRDGYMRIIYPTFEPHVFQFGAWRTEEEIKQVVVALQSVFKGI